MYWITPILPQIVLTILESCQWPLQLSRESIRVILHFSLPQEVQVLYASARLLFCNLYILFCFVYFFFLGRSFHGMSTNFFSVIWGTIPYVVSWVLINSLFGEKSAYGDDYRRKVEDIKMISAIGVTLKFTVFFVPLGTVFHAVWRMHFMLHVFTTFMLNAFLFMNFGILLWRFCFLLAYKICFYFS